MRRAFLVLALALTGCAAAPVVPVTLEPGGWTERRASLQALPAWELAGRVSVSGHNQGWSATVNWRQQRATSTVDVRGPFGAGAVRLVVEPGRAVYDDGSGPALLADDLDGDLSARLGVGLPVRSLRYWVLGVPDPATPAAEHLGAQGLPDWFEQDGWRVQFGRYGSTALGTLPVRIAAERSGTRIRLAIDGWSEGTDEVSP